MPPKTKEGKTLRRLNEKPDYNLVAMKKNLLIIIVGLLTAVLAATGCWAITKEDNESDPTPNQYSNTITAPPVPQSMTFAGEEVPLDVYWVHESLDRELIINSYQHSKTLRIIKLSTRIFPVIEKILKEEGVPDDFKYLCVAESGLENVTSPANAGGYWQFIPSTAKIYGLEISSDVDERCHLEKSTRAACRYLKKMKNLFGSWTMAAAAYNRGDGGLQAAVNDQQQNNYWDLWLNSETSRYIYRILSFKLIFENPKEYGVTICPAQMYHPIETKTVTVTASIASLPRFAEEHHVTYRELRDLNPWIRNNKLTVATGKTYKIEIPQNPKSNYRDLFKYQENPYLNIGH